MSNKTLDIKIIDAKLDGKSCDLVYKRYNSTTVRCIKIGRSFIYCAKDISRNLGYKNHHAAIKRHCIGKLYHVLITAKLTNKNSTKSHVTTFQLVFISKKDAIKLFQGCKTDSDDNRNTIAKILNANSVYQYSRRDETEFIGTVHYILKRFGMKGYKQFRVGKYKIDYYILNIKLAIEYDEDGHRRYDKNGENKRREFIESQLGCTFCRVDSRDGFDSNLFDVISAIYNLTDTSYYHLFECGDLRETAKKWYKKHGKQIPDYLK